MQVKRGLSLYKTAPSRVSFNSFRTTSSEIHFHSSQQAREPKFHNRLPSTRLNLLRIKSHNAPEPKQPIRHRSNDPGRRLAHPEGSGKSPQYQRISNLPLTLTPQRLEVEVICLPEGLPLEPNLPAIVTRTLVPGRVRAVGYRVTVAMGARASRLFHRYNDVGGMGTGGGPVMR